MRDDSTAAAHRRGRAPRWVYGSGKEPDPRFSLANERTFLAWIRTAMALIAGAVAVHAVTLPVAHWVSVAVSVILLIGGAALPPIAWWMRCLTERAMRLGRSLPSTLVTETLLAVTLVGVTALFAVGIYLE